VAASSAAAVEPREIGMDLAAGALVAGGPGIRLGGILDVGLEVPVLELFPLEVSRFGRESTIEMAALVVRTELAFFGVADYPSRPIIRRGDAVLGNYRVWSIGGLLRAGACLDLIAAVPCVSAGVGVERVAGFTTGVRLFDQRREAAAGAIIDFAFRLGLRLGLIGLYFRGEVVIRPRPLVFTVAGADNAYEDPMVSGLVSLGLAVQLF
jgi:hypothetical protein